jgi:hypothetical protein
MFTRSVPAMSAEMTLEMWKWPFPWTCSISSRSVGNDFPHSRGNHGNRYFQMSTIFTPTGDQPAVDMVGRPRP